MVWDSYESFTVIWMSMDYCELLKNATDSFGLRRIAMEFMRLAKDCYGSVWITLDCYGFQRIAWNIMDCYGIH